MDPQLALLCSVLIAMGHQGVALMGLQVVTEFLDKNVTVVLTVCQHAHETCPHFPAKAKVVHYGFDDPPHLAEGLSEEEALPIYRRVRDEIEKYLEENVQTLVHDT